MVTWRVCIVVATALLFVFFGDLLGLSMGKDRKMPVSRQSPTLRDDQPTIYLDSRNKSKKRTRNPSAAVYCAIAIDFIELAAIAVSIGPGRQAKFNRVLCNVSGGDR